MIEKPIEDDENLVRDMNNKAILNTNMTALQAYRKRRDRDKEMDQLRTDVDEIKSLLKQLLNKEG